MSQVSTHTDAVHDAPSELVEMDVVRLLSLVGARINAAADLAETLQAVVDGIVQALGFGAAVVNYRLDDGAYRVMAIAGPAEIRETLADSITPGDRMDELLSSADHWGELRYLPHERYLPDGDEWVPDIPVHDDPSMWHPEDMLMVPLSGPGPKTGDDQALVGVIMVDLPPEGRVPSSRLQELLELFALQATMAIIAAKQRAEHSALLTQLASQDELTGLPNRRALGEALDDAIHSARTTPAVGALFFCDVDGLKDVNDRFGHHVGDLALRAVADALCAAVRGQDLVARLGGDEFVIVADVMDEAGADKLERRLRALTIPVAEVGATLTVSVGMVSIDGELAAYDLLRSADERMYKAKSGRES